MADRLQKLQAIHAVHAQVAQGDIHRADLVQHRQRLCAVRGLEHLRTAQLLQHAHGNGALERMIFKDDDTQSRNRHWTHPRQVLDAHLVSLPGEITEATASVVV